MLWLAGHQAPNSAVNASKARSGGAATRTSLRTGSTVIVVMVPLLARRFRRIDMGGEGGERRRPEPVEPGPQGLEPLRVGGVVAPRALGADGDEAGVEQDPQVLGHGRPGDREAVRELADRAGAVGECLEHGPAGR